MAKRKELESFNEEQSVDTTYDSGLGQPYRVHVTIEGSADMMFHKWNNAPEVKEPGVKNPTVKDNPELSVYRDDNGLICLPSTYIVRSIVEAGRFYQDPRNKKARAKELVQATVIGNEMLMPITPAGEKKHAKDWDYLDRRRVTIQRAAITRTRPAFKTGWTCSMSFSILAPALIPTNFFRALVDTAGSFVGVGDFRPSFGRFKVVKWEVEQAAA